MLDLLQSYAGYPTSGLHYLIDGQDALILYTFADSIVILNARTLALVRVLTFLEVFPETRHTNDKATCISVDPGMKLIVASMKTRIAVWNLSGVQNDTWRVHSSLVLPDGHTVTTLDCKSGLLIVGSQKGLSVYTLILDNDLPTWSQKWISFVIAPSLARFSPSLMCIAVMTSIDNTVRVYSTTSGRQTQLIPHPRPVTDVSWRRSQASSRDDLILYTITSDSTLRIFLPVLDSPQYLQLHLSLDLFSSTLFSGSPKFLESEKSSVFWLDRQIISDTLAKVLVSRPDQDDARSRRLRDIKEGGWDLFLRVLADGTIIVTAVANIDRRPPTLLKQFTLQQSLPSSLPSVPTYLRLLPTSDSTSMTLITSPPLMAFDLDPSAFFDTLTEGLNVIAQGIDRIPDEELEIVRFIRTPEGKGVGVIRSGRVGEAWRVVDRGRKLVRSGRWSSADHVVLLAGGRNYATYSTSNNVLTLNSHSSTDLLLPPITSLFSLPSNNNYESIIGITPELAVVHVHVSNAPALTLISHDSLPLSHPPKFILPVDPMAWSTGNSWTEHDVLLSVSSVGELAFWVPDEGSPVNWRCTGKVRTGRTEIRLARCSSAKKTVLVVPGPEGEELTVWDSQESQFASGLEYCRILSVSEPINDLDWSSTPDNQSILAVGFAHHVEILCQQRMTYFDEGPGWSLCWKIEVGNFVPYPISDSIWLANGSLLLGAGHQMFLFGQRGIVSKAEFKRESLFEYVARHNGPLPDYHPQMLLQCLLWEKVELVKDIIVNLSRDVTKTGENRKSPENWSSISIDRFLRKDQMIKSNDYHQRKRYSLLFNSPGEREELEEETFSRPLVLRLIETLEADPIPHLTPNEQAHLLVLIQTTLEIDEQRRALDANGLRYLISMRSFYILNHRASQPSSPESKGVIPRQTGRRERLRYRDIVWAFHSESQELLLNASTTACNGKISWSDARALGIPIWLNSVESLKSQMEVIARNEYMMGDNRDPTSCSLYYFALGKSKLVHGLWRQAAWHKEQAVMLKFLSNDFTEPRWRTAALKNAYALLSKRRFEYAAAFFLLGSALKDAVNVCIKQLSDFQLAIALARIVEQSNEGPVLIDILRNTVLPLAFKNGNRWLGSWAFWLLHRRDLAVRILLTPIQDIAAAIDICVSDIGEPHYDDPSLALLFSQLRSKTLQAAKGTSEISGRTEFNFVLQIARVFSRMGCQVLALDLVRSWSFDRPSTIVRGSLSSPGTQHRIVPPSPTLSRRPIFALEPAMRRRSSILIDMDILSLPPTRAASPDRVPQKPETITEEPIKDEGDLFARKAGLGSLMKSAKQDIKVPEFDMNAFF